MTSLLDEAQELIKLSLKADINKTEYDHKAQLWLEKAKTTLHTHDGASNSCSSCGFDLSCPSCGSD